MRLSSLTPLVGVLFFLLFGCVTRENVTPKNSELPPLSASQVESIKSVTEKSSNYLTLLLNAALADEYLKRNEPNSAKSRFLLAGFDAIKDGDASGAMAYLAKARQIKEGSGYASPIISILSGQLEAEILFKNGRHGDATKKLLALEKNYPDEPRIWYARIRYCELLLRRNHPTECIREIQRWRAEGKFDYDSIDETKYLLVWVKYLEASIATKLASGCSENQIEQSPSIFSVSRIQAESSEYNYLESLMTLNTVICIAK